MIIEWLKFRVPADQRERYVQLDDEIWTAALQTYPGFLSKETWISPEDEEAVILVIRWRTREEWKAIPEDELAEIEARFDEAVPFEYILENVKEFQVRRFPVSYETPR
ncbi:MAG: TIGR03792 family protein [Leptolyngbya sp. SIO1E4]|nr:TIGR03792 family protein [Leptolyngbya sp. SIO1E4]